MKALPTLKNKEAALRLEVKKVKTSADHAENEIQRKLNSIRDSMKLWTEFNTELIPQSNVTVSTIKIAGVSIPVIKEILFTEKDFSVFEQPKWFSEGIVFLKEVAGLTFHLEFFKRKMLLLEHARRKTTQKVNLYEKVQIPGFEDAIRKIKRFLEDEENLSKSAQKIVKKRKLKQQESVA